MKAPRPTVVSFGVQDTSRWPRRAEPLAKRDGPQEIQLYVGGEEPGRSGAEREALVVDGRAGRLRVACVIGEERRIAG